MPLPVNRSTLSISDPVSVSFSNNAIGKAALEFSFQLVSQPFLAVKVAEILPVFNHHYVQSASAGLSDYLRMVLSHGAAALRLTSFHSTPFFVILLSSSLGNFFALSSFVAETPLAIRWSLHCGAICPLPLLLKYVPLYFPHVPQLTFYTCVRSALQI